MRAQATYAKYTHVHQKLDRSLRKRHKTSWSLINYITVEGVAPHHTNLATQALSKVNIYSVFRAEIYNHRTSLPRAMSYPPAQGQPPPHAYQQGVYQQQTTATGYQYGQPPPQAQGYGVSPSVCLFWYFICVCSRWLSLCVCVCVRSYWPMKLLWLLYCLIHLFSLSVCVCVQGPQLATQMAGMNLQQGVPSASLIQVSWC